MILTAIILAVSMIMAGCGKSNSSGTGQSNVQEKPQTGESKLSGAEADFVWDEDAIVDLSDEGFKKTDLVIPTAARVSKPLYLAGVMRFTSRLSRTMI